MSIIQEALKKAQGQQTRPDAIDRPEKEQQSESSLPALPQNPAVTVSKGKAAGDKNRLKPDILLVTVLIIVAAFFVIQFLPKKKVSDRSSSIPTQPTQETVYKNIAAPETKAGDTAVTQGAPAKDIPSDCPNFVLNGIMYLEDGPRAIIDNAIITEGDTIKGARITKIDRKSVVLRYNDVEITLNLK